MEMLNLVGARGKTIENNVPYVRVNTHRLYCAVGEL